jgi:hypothetical protein
MATPQIEVFQILKSKFGEYDAGKVVTFISESVEKNVHMATENLLTKEDKIDILTRISGLEVKMNEHFKWLVGIMLTAIGVAVAIAKVL